MSVTDLLTLGVLLSVVAALVLRPGGLSEGIAAVVGAGVTLVLGTASPADVWRGTVETAGVLVFLVAMMLIALVAEEAGCFDWAASRAVALSRGSGRLLFLNLYLLGALVTIFLSLDVTAIMLAPIVCALVRRARLSPLPYVLGCAYVANTASLFLPVSNLTNMLVYSLLKVPFWTFARLMTLPNLAAMAVNLLVFLVIFRRQIPLSFSVSASTWPSLGKPASRWIQGIGLGCVVIGLLVAGALALPLYLPALVGALILTPIAVLRRDVAPRRLLKGVAWSLPFFVIGMYTVIVAADRAGLRGLWSGLLASSREADLGSLLSIAFGSGVGANLFNNIPMSLVVITGLTAMPGSAALPLSFASLIGTNVGPNVTVFGSLATILVLNAARRYDISISPVQYFRIGALTTPLMVLAATVALWLLVR
ncbi:MAG: ArsB/NhaD family transporter [Chloroflexota bacterium]